MLKLYTKTIPSTQNEQSLAIESIKKYFIKEISTQRTYKNYSIIYHSFDNHTTDGEKCFEKFAIGKTKNHQTRRPDLNRVKRLHWVHSILDYMISHNFTDPTGMIKVVTDSVSTTKDKFNLYLVYEKHLYMLVMNVRKKVIMVSTAYQIDQNQINKYLRMRLATI